jgi:GTPase SAR1 family protein
MVVCGPTQSGKTGFVLKLIDNSSTVIQPAPVKILYCFSEYQPATFDSYRNRVQTTHLSGELKTMKSSTKQY